MGLMPGCEVPRPNMVKRDELGTGGNGTVFKQYIGGQEYAIKKVRMHYPARLLFSCNDHLLLHFVLLLLFSL